MAGHKVLVGAKSEASLYSSIHDVNSKFDRQHP